MAGPWRSIIVLLAILSACPSSKAIERGFVDKFCIDPPHDRLCGILPYDQADFSSDFDYMLVEKGAQDPFDVFSWQAFVALNWPANVDGTPLAETIGNRPETLRVWQSFPRRAELFGPDPARHACGTQISDRTLLVGDLIQSDGSVLVDRSGNFAVYTTYANPVVAKYILDNGLTDIEGQRRFTAAHPVAFPRGRLSGNGKGQDAAPPSVTLKMAWRVLDDEHDQHFLTRPAVIYVPPARAIDRKPHCIKATLGLVGMHIAMRTESGNGSEWIWATFEHVTNAPTAGNARNVNSIYADDLFAGGCTNPENTPELSFSFHDRACRNCNANAHPASDWRWSNSPPFARDAVGRALPRTQVVRCWEVFSSTAEVNRLWQAKLNGTVFANYMLISTQWRGTEPHPLFEHGEVPRYLTNVTLETYQQTAKNGTCLGCHATAETVTGTPADFVFMLQRASSKGTRH